jgi:hypothetical protein
VAESNWYKSSYSGDSANCVEVAQVPGGRLVRDSKRPDDGHLTVTQAAWHNLIGAAKDGSLDL